MKRSEIEAEYTVVDGRITDLFGKFHNLPVYAPHFHEYADDGEVLSYIGDCYGDHVSLVEIDEDDRREFPELDEAAKYVCVTETDQGFVYTDELTEAEAEALRQEYEEDEEDEEDDSQAEEDE